MEENSKILGTNQMSVGSYGWQLIFDIGQPIDWYEKKFTAPRPICLSCDQEEQAINISDPLVSSPENFVFSSRGKWGWASAHLMRVGLLHGSATLAEKVLNPRSMDTDDCVLNRSSPRLATALLEKRLQLGDWSGGCLGLVLFYFLRKVQL
jgi:hypothetical protein